MESSIMITVERIERMPRRSTRELSPVLTSGCGVGSRVLPPPLRLPRTPRLPSLSLVGGDRAALAFKGCADGFVFRWQVVNSGTADGSTREACRGERTRTRPELRLDDNQARSWALHQTHVARAYGRRPPVRCHAL